VGIFHPCVLIDISVVSRGYRLIKTNLICSSRNRTNVRIGKQTVSLLSAGPLPVPAKRQARTSNNAAVASFFFFFFFFFFQWLYRGGSG
jgi:hypothetical protein